MMMSFDRKRDEPHIRLPSFNELTSNFSNKLNLETPRQETKAQLSLQATSHQGLPVAQRTQQPQQPPSQHQAPSQQQPQSQPQSTPVVAPHLAEMSAFHFPGRPAPVPPPIPPPHQQSLPPPSGTGAVGERNYVTFNDARRNSLAHSIITPTQHRHQKNDSYDSQTSLSTLADIASSTKSDAVPQPPMAPVAPSHHPQLLGRLETMLWNFDSLQQIVSDVKNDFHSQLEQSCQSELFQQQQQDADPLLPLRYEYGQQDGVRVMRARFFAQFLANIPDFQLRDAAQFSTEMADFFAAWLHEREASAISPSVMIPGRAASMLQLQPPFEDSQQQAQRNQRKVQHRKSLSTSSTIKRGNLKQLTTDLKKKTKKRMDEDALFEPVTPVSASVAKSEGISPRKRKHPRSNSKSDIALIVKPLVTPTSNTSQPTAPGSGGALQADLFIKSDQKCKQCGSDDTPEWRRGPYGTRSLCNACGLFFGKLTKKFGVDDATSIMVERKDKGMGDDRRIPSDN